MLCSLAHAIDEDDSTASGLVNTATGSIELTDSKVIIDYAQDGVNHEVEYRLFDE